MGSRLKSYIKSSVKRLGYTVVPNEGVDLVAQEHYLRRLFAELQIDCVLDVGANVGQYRDFLRYSVGYRGRIISFEPIPEHAEYLRKRAAEPNWAIKNYALGAESGTADFNVMKASVFSSFRKPDASKVKTYAAGNEVRETIKVDVRRLDDVLASLRVAGSRLYLKMDTQGFDLEVVKGAAETLRDVAALQTEASVAPIYAEMPDYITSIRTLEGLGFRLARIFTVDDSNLLQLVEFDCHMINRRFG